MTHVNRSSSRLVLLHAVLTNTWKGLLAALDEGEVDQYTQVVADYDAISPLDDWMTKILLTIKRTLDEDELR